ncbi:DUF4124 domain-containing protein [Stenotrophomonas tumulicola]|uniref:DUF4124 domain-containing protein n=1 Tax=Stenotrophomonas tumulicola TaxID=1685415 RepID=A0A7W3FKR2_9GAMM|nr:DUF4124 domain-containing protein [Stenotrophomonas tumulicola]MBA8681386.1 DUF4124 domain-containing protein [Stenotrophomonas tumulicola]
MRLSPALLLLALPLAAHPAPPTSDGLRVYRCVGSNGTVSLQDSPCTSGRQQVREMQRPQDPPQRQASTDTVITPAAASAQAPREIRHVYILPPRPMYECTTDEGQRYVSDSNEGNPRWVPLWASAWVPGGHRGWRGGSGLPPVRAEGRDGVGSDHGAAPGLGHRPPAIGVGFPAGNVLVRDACHALPPQEACARLRDQRWELDRRYNSALQGERQDITREQRGIDARLDQDCGGR